VPVIFQIIIIDNACNLSVLLDLDIELVAYRNLFEDFLLRFEETTARVC
jgi:hypothetical protein